MRKVGWEAKVEDIATQAAVSSATFYNFYKSRNLLCMDAFTVLVLEHLEQTTGDDQSLEDRARALMGKAVDRADLVRGALAGRLESGRDPRRPGLIVRAPTPGATSTWYLELRAEHDFVDRTAKLLADRTLLRQGNPDSIALGLHMGACWLLDSIASQDRRFNLPLFARATLAACVANPQGARADIATTQTILDQMISEAQAQAEQLLREAKGEVERHRAAAQREIDEFIKQRDEIARHLAEARKLIGEPGKGTNQALKRGSDEREDDWWMK
jgi:hypothetical protein